MPEGKTEPLTGALVLKTEPSTTELNFGDGTSEKRLIFMYGVDGCTLGPGQEIDAKPHLSDLDVRAVFGEAEIDPKGSLLIVEVPVKPEEFDPGKYQGSITVSGPTIVPSSVKISVRRTEPPLVPLIIGLAFALIGFAAAWVRTSATSATPFKPKPIVIAGAIVATAVAAGAVWKGAYLDAEVWKLDFKAFFTLMIGMIPAAFGAAVAAFVKKDSGPNPNP